MTRSHRFLLLGAASAALVLAGSVAAQATATPTPAAAPPNVVFVLTDDLSWNLVQYLPQVKKLQADGLTFNDYTVTDSLCCPSRSSILTGRFPHDTGVFTNGGPDGGFGYFHNHGEESQTFATALQAKGYRTAMMGKYLNGYLPADTLGGTRPYVPPGWTEWDVAGNGYPEFNYNLNENHTVVHYGSRPPDYLTDVLARKGSTFIANSAALHPGAPGRDRLPRPHRAARPGVQHPAHRRTAVAGRPRCADRRGEGRYRR